MSGYLDAAIEAAARTWWQRGQNGRMDDGRFRDDGQLLTWDDIREDDRHALRMFVRPIVEAALGEVDA